MPGECRVWDALHSTVVLRESKSMGGWGPSYNVFKQAFAVMSIAMLEKMWAGWSGKFLTLLLIATASRRIVLDRKSVV